MLTQGERTKKEVNSKMQVYTDVERTFDMALIKILLSSSFCAVLTSKESFRFHAEEQ